MNFIYEYPNSAYYVEDEIEKYSTLIDTSLFESPLFQEMIHSCIKYEQTFTELNEYIMNALENGISEETIEYLAGIGQDDVFIKIEQIKEIIEILSRGYYIYELIDPATDTVFYVGKGSCSRILHHEMHVAAGDHYNKQLHAQITEIISRGDKIRYRIVSHSIPDSDSAYLIEKETIEYYGIDN